MAMKEVSTCTRITAALVGFLGFFFKLNVHDLADMKDF